MKFLLLSFLISFNRPEVINNEYVLNKNEILNEFKTILNNYRKVNGLNELEIDYGLKLFCESHSKFMSINEKVTHGEGDNLFSKRALREFGYVYGGENCAEIIVPKIKSLPSIKWNVNELNPIMDRLLNGTATSHDFAMYVFILWKNSEGHNKLLINPNVKRFYLSFDKNKTFYYFEYVSLT